MARDALPGPKGSGTWELDGTSGRRDTTECAGGKNGSQHLDSSGQTRVETTRAEL